MSKLDTAKIMLYNSFISEINKYIFTDKFYINRDKAENGFNLLKDGKYIDIIKRIKGPYTERLKTYENNNICPFKYDVNIFSHNMKSKSEGHFDKEVLYTKLLNYFFNIKDIGIYLYRSILKSIGISTVFDETEEINSEAEKEIEVNNRTRRLDIFIKTSNSCSIIEAKINSGVHDNQLNDYSVYGNDNKVDYFIYLVLDKNKFIEDYNWYNIKLYNITWSQLACALYAGLIKSQKQHTPAGIYLQFFISNIFYHLYDVDYYNIEGKPLSDSFHSIRYIIDFINNVENMA